MLKGAINIKTISDFYDELKTNPELQEKLAAIGLEGEGKDQRKAFDVLLPVIREAGYDFTYDDVKAYAEENKPEAMGEMSLDELDAVAGGGAFCFGWGFGTEGKGDAPTDDYMCGCWAYGQGKSNGQNNCICIMYGLGVGRG